MELEEVVLRNQRSFTCLFDSSRVHLVGSFIAQASMVAQACDEDVDLSILTVLT